MRLELDGENRVVSAKSYDGTVNAGCTFPIWRAADWKNCGMFCGFFPEEDEPVLVAGASLKRRAEKDTDALWEEICETGREHLSARGEKKDVREADNRTRALGFYLFEKAVDEDALAEYFGDEQDEKLAVFFEKVSGEDAADLPQICTAF